MFKKGYFKIEVKQLISPEYYKKLEDRLKEFFRKEGLAVSIYDSVTGNSTKNYGKEE